MFGENRSAKPAKVLLFNVKLINQKYLHIIKSFACISKIISIIFQFLWFQHQNYQNITLFLTKIGSQWLPLSSYLWRLITYTLSFAIDKLSLE